MQRYKLLIFVAAIVVILDQLTKAVITNYFILHQSIEVIRGLFNITYIRNPGAAFGILRDVSGTFRTIFLTGISFTALIIIFFVYRNIKDTTSRIAFSLIAGGAFGNLIDRIRFGEVIDFLDFYIGRYHWPAFNVADSAITVGVFIAVLFLYRDK
ncbi:MAG TPA: signal peptidase II, partial [Candidatus Brocadiales bacterium]|nr:signal peptidase II [Candidatus Brocadiales bacterium]